jgi:hypothetical protein
MIKTSIIISFISLTFLIPNPVLANSCDTPSKPSEYLKLQEYVNTSLRHFSNGKVVASNADHTFSALIKAKSPVITSWFHRRNLSSKSEEYIAKAWRVYYAKNFLLSRYPHKKEALNIEVEKHVDKIINKFTTIKFKKKMEVLFSRAREAAVSFIKKSKLSKSNKVVILERITSIKLYWPKNLKSSKNNAVPLDIIDWGIAYDPIPNEINMGLDSWRYNGEETYIAVFAHEIGHSIDSCRWGAFFKGDWPFDKVGKCLRSGNSVSAKKRDDSQIDALISYKRLSKELGVSLKRNPTCNKSVYPPRGFQKDQLPESFSDWFSAEVVAILKSKSNFSKLRLDLCNAKKLVKGSSYATNKLRLEAIYKTHPTISNKLNYKSNYKYCSL